MRAERILETVLYVENLDAAERFYTQVLGLERYSRRDPRSVFFRCGNQLLLCFVPEVTRDPASAGHTVPPHGADGAGHLAFAARREELEGWRRHLSEHEIEIEREVAWENGARSLYFRDPSGNSIEIATPDLWGL